MAFTLCYSLKRSQKKIAVIDAALGLLFTSSVEGRDPHPGTAMDLKPCAEREVTQNQNRGSCYDLTTLSLYCLGEATSPLWASFLPYVLREEQNTCVPGATHISEGLSAWPGPVF